LAKFPGWARDLPWGVPGPGKAPQSLGFAHTKAKYSSALAARPVRPYCSRFFYLRSRVRACPKTLFLWVRA
jgi:hypothetical protein